MNLQATSQILVEQIAEKGSQSSLISQINLWLAYHEGVSCPLLWPVTAFSNIQLLDLTYGRSDHMGSLVARDYLVIIERTR